MLFLRLPGVGRFVVALSFLLLASPVLPARAQCLLTTALDPDSGSTPPGGAVEFTVRGVARGNCSWQVRPSLDPSLPGITLAAEPETGLFPANSLGAMKAVLRVAASVAPGTYDVRVRLDLVRILGEPQIVAPQFHRFTLTVLDAPPGPANLVVFPSGVDFGEVPVGRGAPAERVVALRNAGQDLLLVSAVEIRGGFESPFFFFFFCDGAPAGFVIRPGETRQLRVCFSPGAVGSFQDALLIRSNDPDESVAVVPLRGRTPGVPDPLQVEVWVDRGCGATYPVGSPAVIRYWTSRDAVVTLRLRVPDGSQRILVGNQRVSGGVRHSFSGTVTEPVGERRLFLEASSGFAQARSECTYIAGRAGIAELRAHIVTNQGCLERGENAVYFVGDRIEVRFRVEGAERALAQIDNLTPDGRRRIVFNQEVLGGRTLSLTGEIGPLLGRQALRLIAVVGRDAAMDQCSFLVQDEKTPIELKLRLVKITNARGGSKTIAGKLAKSEGELTREAKQFVQGLQDRVNAIWDQVRIRFAVVSVEELEIKDATSFAGDGTFVPVNGSDISPGALEMFDFQKQSPGVLHVFFVEKLGGGKTGSTVSRGANDKVRDSREEAETPGNAILLVEDSAFAAFTARRGEETRERTAEEALAETVAHEIGHGLGLPDIAAGHVENAWRNLMWNNRLTRLATLLGTASPGGEVGLARGQTKQARATATGLKEKER